MKTGRLISFEGVDGAGKSTHMHHVQTFLQAQGIECVVTREPGGTPIGERLRELVLHQPLSPKATLALMYAARIEHVEQLIQPALKRGAWVLSDRFEDSSFAYQGGGDQLGFESCHVLSQWALNGFQPHLTFLFDLPIEISSQRMLTRNAGAPSDRFEARSLAWFEAVRQAFLQRAKNNPTRVVCLDAQQTEIQVAEAVLNHLQKFWQQCLLEDAA